MNFIVDECTGPKVAEWLRGEGHDVLSIFDADPGLDDEKILERAFAENRILLTADKDFGDLIFREKQPHHGVVLLRLRHQSSANHITALDRLLTNHPGPLEDRFVVVTDSGIRMVNP